MSTKHEYLLQKGRQLQALNAQVVESTTTTSSSTTKTTHKQKSELARVRELCPTGTDDSVLLALLAAAKGDQARTEQAISELWENHRGDVWATVEKKGKKKAEAPRSGGFSGRGGRGERPPFKTTATSANASAQPQDGADEDAEGNNTGGRGGGSARGGFTGVRGRGAPAARGGRGAVRGRGGRGAAPRSGTREAGDADDNTDGDAAAEDAAHSKDKRKDKDAQQNKQAETQPAAVTPPPVIPGLTGAWTKKPNLAGLIQPQPKPVEQPKPVAASEKPATAPAPVATPTPLAQPTPASPAVKSPATAPAKPALSAVLSPKATAASPKKTVASPVAAKTTVEKIASPKAVSPKKLDSSSISAWGSLDVSTTTIGDWAAATTTTTTTTEKKTVQTPNAWARGSPIITSDASSTPATPVSPKEIPVARQEPLSGASATSPKYLKLGRWESGVAANLSLQFGSFSLNGVEHTEATSPRGWGAASSTPSTKGSAKTTEASNAWGTQPTSSPKKKSTPLSPVRATESEERKTSAPPGLSVDSGRVTPKSAQSPRGFAPSAPSPASLPKPDEVKRSTPTRAQGGPFQAAPQAQASSKIGSGSSYASEFSTKSSSIYQSTYGQYAMGLGATNQTQLSTSNTPKGAAARASGPAAAAVQSPSHGAQQAQAAQYQAQTQQAQQQKPVQQAQQTQAQQHQHQAQQGQAHGHQQNVPPHHQAGPPGYHPHYAPPPPPGMAMAYNPYNYASYYQGYGYYQNPQYAQYSPRTQYPPRGSIPYGVEGPMPGFSNPPNVPVGYQDQHSLHQHDYPGAIPQGFGEISNAYLQQPGHHHHSHQASGPQSHGKGNNQSASSQQPRSGSGMQGYQNAAASSTREHGASAPPVPNPSANAATAAAASYGQQQQHYGWASYGAQPMGGWGHMMPQGYQQQQQNPSQHQQHQGSHNQQSYRQQYGANSSQTGAGSTDATSGNPHAHTHAWSS